MNNNNVKVWNPSDLIIKYTDDPTIFKKLKGNRDVSMERVHKILASIMKIGYVPVPIVVNEDYCIIDGQGRLEALRKLGIPVAYIMVKGLGVDDCIAMNISGTPWTNKDYIRSFAEQGNENYERLRKLMDDEFPGIRLTNVLFSTTGKSSCTESIRNESIILTEDGQDYAYRLLGYATNLKESVSSCGASATMLNAIMFAVQVDSVDPDRLSDVIERNGRQSSGCSDMESCLEWITEIYNYRFLRGSNRIMFWDEYENVLADQNSWYQKKWGWSDAAPKVVADEAPFYQEKLQF